MKPIDFNAYKTKLPSAQKLMELPPEIAVEVLAQILVESDKNLEEVRRRDALSVLYFGMAAVLGMVVGVVSTSFVFGVLFYGFTFTGAGG